MSSPVVADHRFFSLCPERSYRARIFPALNFFQPVFAGTIATEKLKFMNSNSPTHVALLLTRCEALLIPYRSFDQEQKCAERKPL